MDEFIMQSVILHSGSLYLIFPYNRYVSDFVFELNGPYSSLSILV